MAAWIKLTRLLVITIPTALRDLPAPLFDPQLVRMTNSQMTLHGHQIHAETGTVVHYVQCWALRQVADLNA